MATGHGIFADLGIEPGHEAGLKLLSIKAFRQLA